MKNQEYSANELALMSEPYFASNPDVEVLVAVVGTGEFYRPEREDTAKYEAEAAGTTTMRVTRHQLDTQVARDVEGANALPEFPPQVDELEFMLSTTILDKASLRKLAELVYLAALHTGATRVQATEQLEMVTEFLMEEFAKGVDLPEPEPVKLMDEGQAVAEAADEAADEVADKTVMEAEELVAKEAANKEAADKAAQEAEEVAAKAKAEKKAKAAAAKAAKKEVAPAADTPTAAKARK